MLLFVSGKRATLFSTPELQVSQQTPTHFTHGLKVAYPTDRPHFHVLTDGKAKAPPTRDLVEVARAAADDSKVSSLSEEEQHTKIEKYNHAVALRGDVPSGLRTTLEHWVYWDGAQDREGNKLKCYMLARQIDASAKKQDPNSITVTAVGEKAVSAALFKEDAAMETKFQAALQRKGITEQQWSEKDSGAPLIRYYRQSCFGRPSFPNSQEKEEADEVERIWAQARANEDEARAKEVEESTKREQERAQADADYWRNLGIGIG